MDYIVRTKYIEKIKEFVDKPIIKVITGMRRVGKSTLLAMISDQLLPTVPETNKIFLNFESLDLMALRKASDLAQFILSKKEKTVGKIYYFFDEIQLIDGWEQVVNGLNTAGNCDIYITGSNSKLISGDLATLLAGRYVAFEIYPFTFREFCVMFESQHLPTDRLFEKYIKLGGMPFLKYFHLDEAPSHKYLNDVYNTAIVKDVLRYNNIRDVDLFNRILAYVMQNIGCTFSANSIHRYFKSENRAASVDTILNYLEYCVRAFIIKKVPRYDAIGKKLLQVDEKYYLSDHGFRQAKGFSNQKDIERVLENIVFVELLSRGFQVEIGRVQQKEIDFVARRGEKVRYIQVTYLMETKETRAREFEVYREIEDNYPKFVLSMDRVNFSQDGIIHQNILDFVLDENSLRD